MVDGDRLRAQALGLVRVLGLDRVSLFLEIV
jgi:hypothetical protein